MKKTTLNIFAACLTILSAVACAKENAPEAKTETLSLEALNENDQESKTLIGSIDKTGKKATTIWLETDALSAFSTNISGANNKLTCVKGSVSGGTASFTGNIETGSTGFVALYPYDAEATYSSNVLSTTLPAAQSATANSFADGVSLSAVVASKTPGVPACGPFVFKNLCSTLAFDLPSEITFANKITVSSKDGKDLAGAVQISCGETPAITSVSGSKAIVLSGSFSGGNTYCVCVAPGTYTQGFRFVIETAGGNSYTRETTKSITAAAGSFYPLGKLSLLLADSYVKPNLSIAHNVASNVLNGSTASISYTNNVPAELAGIVSKWNVSATLTKGGQTYRTLSYEGASLSNMTMTDSNSWPYLPKGEYDYSVTVSYTTNSGKKTLGTYTGKVSSPQPSGFALNANLTGYTSYSCYTGADGQSKSTTNANNCDNATIYSIGASYASGLGFNTSKYTSLIGITSKLDGSAKSGNQGGQSWAAHTISASWSFDGASGNCATTRTVYVTGLPFAKGKNLPDVQSSWSTSGNTSWQSNCLKCWGSWGDAGGNASSTIAVIPTGGSVNIRLSYRMELNARTSQTAKGRISIDGSEILSKNYYKSWGWGSETHESYSDKTLSAGSHSCALLGFGNDTATEGSAYVNFVYIRVLYN